MAANVSLATNQKMLDYIKRTGPIVAAAEKQAAERMQKDAAVTALIPDVVNALIENGRISEGLREKAAKHLTDHVKTLELLASVAAHRTDAELAHLGTPGGGQQKSASAKVDERTPFVGAHVPEEDRASSSLLFERILGNR